MTIFIDLFRFMPESPRWLITQNRRKEAQTIIENFYGPIRRISDNFEKETKEYEQKKVSQIPDEKVKFWEKWRNLLDLVSHVELRRRIIIVYFAWAATSLSYYAIGKT